MTSSTGPSSAPTASDIVYEPNFLSAGTQSESGDSSPILQHLVSSVPNVVVQPDTQSRYLGHSSGIAFAKMVLATIHVDRNPALGASQQPLSQQVTALSISPSSLPPRSAADHLVEVYFQYRTPHLPILSRGQVIDAIDSAYRSQQGDRTVVIVPEMDMFVAYMVFAIALVDIPHLGGRSSQSEGCFRAALLWVEDLLTYSKSELQTLRVVLLLTQFVALSPSQGSLWHLTGFALRLCVDIGLHWETDSQAQNTDAQVLDDRRRLWHSTYHFDRLMSVTLGRPQGIPDESIRVQLPNPWINFHDGFSQSAADSCIHTQRAHNHLFKLSQLESEIIHVQHSQTWSLKIAHPRPNWNSWLQDIKPRMQEWYATVPEPSKAHPQSIFAFHSYWQVMYNNTVLLLSRPNSITSFQATDQLLSSFDAATRVIDGLKYLQREGRVEMLWKSVHHLFMAGLVVIYGLWRSKEIRDKIPIGRSINALHTCTATLSAMSENFKGASGCRNAFESLSSTIIDWLVAKDIEEVPNNRLEFENQVREVMDHLRSSFNDNNASMGRIDTENASVSSAGENFDLSELLNAAAQWPDLGELDFKWQGKEVL